MNKTSIVLVALFCVGLLVLTGCVGGATGGVPSAPPAPSGGGCGIGAPAETTQAAEHAANTDASTAL